MRQLTLEQNPESVFFMPEDLQRDCPNLVCDTFPKLRDHLFRQPSMGFSVVGEYLKDMVDWVNFEIPSIKEAWIENGFPPPSNYLDDPAVERVAFEKLAKYCMFPDFMKQLMKWYKFSVEGREKVYQKLMDERARVDDSEDPAPLPPPRPMTDDVAFMTSIVQHGHPELFEFASEAVQETESFITAVLSVKPRSGYVYYYYCRHPELLEKLCGDEKVWHFMDAQLPEKLSEQGFLYTENTNDPFLCSVVHRIATNLDQPDEAQRKRNRAAANNLECGLHFFDTESTRSVSRKTT